MQRYAKLGTMQYKVPSLFEILTTFNLLRVDTHNTHII